MTNQAMNYEVDILASMMYMASEAYDTVCDHVDSKDFYDRRNAALFKFCAATIAKGEPVSHEILIERLSSAGRLDSVGGVEHIQNIVRNGSLSNSNLQTKAQWVAKLSGLRKLVIACSTVIEKSTEFDGDLNALIDYADNEMAEIRNVAIRSFSGLRHAKPVLSETINNIESRFNRGSALVGVDTGFTALNDVLLGLAPKDLIILAAVPGMGKTTLAMNMVENALRSDTLNGPVLFFSQEMGDSELMERILPCCAPN